MTKGKTGATGPQGPKGDAGATGATGEPGLQGPAGPGALKLLYSRIVSPGSFDLEPNRVWHGAGFRDPRNL